MEIEEEKKGVLCSNKGQHKGNKGQWVKNPLIRGMSFKNRGNVAARLSVTDKGEQSPEIIVSDIGYFWFEGIFFA